jgi:hypothetical protein
MPSNIHKIKGYNQMIQSKVYESIQEWVSYTDGHNMHKGIHSNRFEELKFWEKFLPAFTFYTLEEKEFTVDVKSVYIELKLMFTALILILDDIVDNATVPENAELIAHLHNIVVNNIPFRRSRYPNTKKGLDIIQSIFDFASSYFTEKTFELYDSSRLAFTNGVVKEIECVNKINQGQPVSFDERLDNCALQGADIACHIDAERIAKAQYQVDKLAFWQISKNLGSLLAIKNSKRTVASEVANGEISSPHFVLACQMEGVLPLNMKGRLDWFEPIAKSVNFKERIEAQGINNLKQLQSSFASNRLDLQRFLTSLGVLDQS